MTRVLKASDHYERRRWTICRICSSNGTATGPSSACGRPWATVEGFYPDYRTGDHREQGAFWITGPGIAARELTSPVSITDFAPAIGELLGVPLPGLDGRPIPGAAG